MQTQMNSIQALLTTLVQGGGVAKPAMAPKPVAALPIVAAPSIVPAQAPLQITAASVLAHADAFVPIAAGIMAFIPQAAPFAPLLTVAQKVLHGIVDSASVAQSNPAALSGLLGSTLNDIAPVIDQHKASLPDWLTAFIGNAAKALPAPAVAAK
jgi:hypothetical protein